MRSAFDCATDEIVDAGTASRRRRYRCPRCYAPVGLRDGDVNDAYFAHEAGKADPDCEDYFGGGTAFGGRSDRRIDAERTSGLDATELYFDFEVSGPILSLWLPASRHTGQWKGYIDVTSASVNRRLLASHLQAGQLISFPLADSQWTISVGSDVDDDYVSRLDLGPGSLESGLNIFDATRSPGRRYGPSSRVRLGDSVWVVTRDSAFPSRCPSAMVECEQRAYAGGWIVLLVSLPRDCDATLIPKLAEWLARPVRFPRATVWIESPFPSRVTQQGMLVYAQGNSAFQLCADQPVDLEIVELSTRTSVLSARNCMRAEWLAPVPGHWIVRANGSEFLQFEITSDIDTRPPALRVELNGTALRDLFDAQDRLTALASDNSEGTALMRLSWSAPTIGRLLRVNGARVDTSPDTKSLELLLVSGTLVAASNLGRACWAPDVASGQIRSTPEKVVRLRHRACWLLSVAGSDARAPERIKNVPCFLRTDDVFRRLLTSKWEPSLSPHVRALEKELEELS